MGEPAKDLFPTNDKFSKIISDGDRVEVLDGPTPLVIGALAETVSELEPDKKRRLKSSRSNYKEFQK